jgi:hypothetical protein
MGRAKRNPSSSAPFARGIDGYRFASPILRDRMTRRDRARILSKGEATASEANGIAHETSWKPERTECRSFLQCNKAINAAPANGQWQFDPLLCIGATGIQASEHVLRKKLRGRKHA